MHCTLDGRFVVRHDARLAGWAGSFISEVSWGQYREACKRQAEPLVTLQEVLDTARSCGLGVYVDLKQALPGMTSTLVGIIRDSSCREAVVVGSSRTDLLKDIRAQDDQLPTSVLFHDPNLDVNALVKSVRCDYLHPCFDIFPAPLKRFTRAWVDRAKDTGAGLIGWNVTTPETAEAIVGMDIDGACADDPRILVAAVGRRRPAPR